MKTKLFILFVLLVMVFGVTYAWADDEKRFTPWLAPVNLGSPVNTGSLESCVSISKDGLSLYFSSTRRSGLSRNLYVSERDSTDDPFWGEPQALDILNNPDGFPMWQSCPALSLDEHRLYFTTWRYDSCGGLSGGLDIYVSRRKNRRDNLGWKPAVNLGCEVDGYVNSIYNEVTPALFEDESGEVIMYFASYNPGFGMDIFESRMRDDDTFGPGTPVAVLNSSFNDIGAIVRRDGLEVIFSTNRPPSQGMTDLWMATRESTFDPWSEPVPVEILNSVFFEGGRISFSFDGTKLYFRSDRTGNGDLYVARREKLGGRK